MRRILICTGVLGGGTALTFAAAALAASLFPSGGLVYAQQSPVLMRGGGMEFVAPAPGGEGVWVPAPGIGIDPAPIVVDDAVDIAVPG